jgi:hypothetical protein
MIGRSKMFGCMARAPVVVVLPGVVIEVDLPLDLEVVIPLEISTVLRLFDLGFPTL